MACFNVDDTNMLGSGDNSISSYGGYIMNKGNLEFMLLVGFLFAAGPTLFIALVKYLMLII